MAFRCPKCGGGCWGTGFGNVGMCQACTQVRPGVSGAPVGGCGFRWQRSRAADLSLGIKPIGAGADVTVPTAPFPIWPMLLVGGLAVGIFVATLAINKKR